jgi:hypothetical protein
LRRPAGTGARRGLNSQHGSGFAGTLAGLSLSGTGLVAPLLTFNLGLDVAQVVALIVVAAQLWVIGRSTIGLRLISAGIATMGAVWLVERALGVTVPLGQLIDTGFSTPEHLALVIVAAVVAATSRLATRRQVGSVDDARGVVVG